MTLWELYDIAARHFDKSPLKLILKRTTGSKSDNLDERYIKTLGELKFGDNEEVEVTTKMKNIKKIPIYSALTNDLTEQVKQVFCKWFEMYSELDEEHG